MSGEMEQPKYERVIRQTWTKCPLGLGIEDLITVESSAGRLVLCEVVEGIWGSSGGIIVRPIKSIDLENCPL